MSLPLVHAPSTPTGARLVSTEGQVLPLQACSLSVRAQGGLATVVLRQRFTNPHDAPLRVSWKVPLPLHAAVGGFSFELDGVRVVGEIDTKDKARSRFEQAMVDGRTAALLEEHRSTLFSQEVGNIPPGGTVVCELALDQRLDWLRSGAWRWRFPTVVAPRFMGAAGRVADAASLELPLTEGPHTPRMSLHLSIADALVPGAGPSSPTHALGVQAGPMGPEVQLAAGGVALDRDIAVDWAVGAAVPGLTLQCGFGPAGRGAADQALGLLTLVPPSPQAELAPVPRDLVVLLDTSGSMGGRPLAQAKQVVAALLGTLRPMDTLEMIEFSTRPRAWRSAPVAAHPRAVAAALSWLHKLRAGGGTRMHDGIVAALQGWRAEARRQVLLITDGLIGFEQEIVAEVAQRLPRGSRVHTLGIGSGVNRSLTGPVARAGGGLEVVVGLDESADLAAASMVAHIDAPQVVDLEVGGTAVLGTACHRLPDLSAGAPVRLGLRLNPQGGELVVRGWTAQGAWEQRRTIPPVVRGAAQVARLVAREMVDDLLLAAAAGGPPARERVEEIGLQHQIATPWTAWVAISPQQTVDPRRPGRREEIPHALPHGMSLDGLGLRAPMARGGSIRAQAMAPPPAPSPAMPKFRSSGRKRKAAPTLMGGIVDKLSEVFGSGAVGDAPGGPPAPAEEAEFDALGMDQGIGRPAPPRAGSFMPALAARLLLRSSDRLVFEAQAPTVLDWVLPPQVELVLASGQRLRCRVDQSASTATGDVQVGEVMRLVVLLPAERPAPGPVASVQLLHPGGEQIWQLGAPA